MKALNSYRFFIFSHRNIILYLLKPGLFDTGYLHDILDFLKATALFAVADNILGFRLPDAL